MTPFKEGDRVQVKPQYDETLRLMNLRTTPGTIDTIYEEHGTAVVNLDSGQGVPYAFHELERVE